MIEQVVKHNLCTQCGTCAGICPNDNIHMVMNKNGEWFPLVGSNCSKCKKCLDSCPGWEVDFNKLNMDIFGKIPENRYLGNFKKCYIGYSKNDEIRVKSSSGGIVTSISLYLLEKKMVNGVVVAVDTADPLHPMPIIARTRKEVLNAMQSKYVSVPINMVIKQVLKLHGTFAFVGLPCQIHGLRKAEKQVPMLSKKIKYKMGLFCAYTPHR